MAGHIMTNIEKKLTDELHKRWVVYTLISKAKRRISKYIDERCLDRFYADSWEQASQISEDIEEQGEKLKYLAVLEQRTRIGERLSQKDIANLRRMVTC